MTVNILMFMLIAAVAVEGQFFDSERIPDNMAQSFRRRLSTPMFEIQPTFARENERQVVELENNPPRRPIESQRQIQNEHIHNVNRMETRPDENGFRNQNQNDQDPGMRQFNSNRGREINYNNQLSDQLMELNQGNNRNKIRPINRSDHQNRNNGEIDPITYRPNNQKIHAGNENSRLNTAALSDASNQQTDALWTHKLHSNKQNTQTDTRITKSDSDIIENRNTNQSKNRLSDITRHENSHQILTGGVPDNERRNINNTDSTNKFNENNLNENTMKPKETKTVHTPRVTPDGTIPPATTARVSKVVTASGDFKSTRDNELPYRNVDGKLKGEEDYKWIWGDGGEMQSAATPEPTASTAPTAAAESTEPAVPTVADRAAFAGDKCPSGKVRFNDICVDKV